MAREECDVALILSKTVTVCDSQCIVKSQLLYNAGFHLKLSLPLKLYFNMNKTLTQDTSDTHAMMDSDLGGQGLRQTSPNQRVYFFTG